MRALLECGEEATVEAEATFGLGVDERGPALDALGIELLIPARVKRVGEVRALAVAAELDHLRAAVQRSARLVRGLADDPAEVDASSLLRLERIADVELQELAGAPSGDIEPQVIQ